jgi:tetratricopeptide (TPR) repeat protein
MKNIKIYIWLSGIVLLSVISACKKDFFKLQSPPETPWLTLNEYDRAVVGAYSAFVGGSWGGGIMGGHRFIKTGGEDVVYWIPGEGGDIPGDAMYYRQFEVDMGNMQGNLGATYQVITNVNHALEFLKNNNGNPFPNAPVAEVQNNIPRIEGELLFLRAISYHELATCHLPWYKTEGGNDAKILPLRLTFPKDQNEASKPYIGTTEEIWQQIVTDLVKAKSLLPESYDASKHPLNYKNGRIDRFGASFLLAKVYFQMGNYPKALEELNYVIDQNGGRYNLSEDPIQAWNKDTEARGKETIWQFPFFDPQEGSQWLVFLSYNKTHMDAKNGGGPASTGGNNSFCPWRGFVMSNKTLKNLGWMDNNLAETEEARKDKRYTQLYYRLEPYKANQTPAERALGIYEFELEGANAPYVWGNKYMRAPVGIESNLPIFRLGEMYLTRAIIRFRKSDLEGARSDINVIRRRAGLPDLLTVTEDQINNERIKEMSWEGDRIDYLRALHLPIPAGERADGRPNNVLNYPYTSAVWVLPVGEIQYNESLPK